MNISSVQTTQRKPRTTSGWSPERRTAHAEAMRRWKPWGKSTGPKTAEGKARSSRNAITHGKTTAREKELHREMVAALRENDRMLRSIGIFISLEKSLKKSGTPYDEAALWKAVMTSSAPLSSPSSRRKPESIGTFTPCDFSGKSPENNIVIPAPVRGSGKTTPEKTGCPHKAGMTANSVQMHPANIKIPQNELLKPASQILHFPQVRSIKRPMNWTVAALYRFVTLTDLPAVQAALQAVATENDICGTILIAPEGVNGTIAGQGAKMDAMIDALDRLTGIREGELKYSHATGKPFLRMKVRIKKEIITMNAPEADPNIKVGTYVEPQDWNDLIADPDVTLIDTRNDYETKIGIFDGALDPDIEKFTDFKDYVAKNLDPKKNKKIAMFCTGGIRCEKASSYMMAHGFDEVYHLKGGILKYLETVPADQSKWKGECFVFDRRVAVGHGLSEGNHDICYGCREPLTQEDLHSETYEKGVSCPHCHADLNEDKRRMLRHRHKQFVQMGTTSIEN